MKKRIVSLGVVFILAIGLLAGCGNGKKADSKDDKVIKIGAGVTPHAEILNEIKDDLAKDGWDLQIVEYNDYVIPNTALESGELDANFFQHKPYLESFNKENDTHIVPVTAVHFEPMGIYTAKDKTLKDVSKGTVVAIPNDTTNEARALLLLEAQGWIKLKKGAGITATIADIKENKYKLDIKELEAAQITKAIKDVDFAVVNGNYAIEGKLNAPLTTETVDSLAAETYTNYICVKEGQEESEKTKALTNAIRTEKVKKFIDGKYKGAVVPVF